MSVADSDEQILRELNIEVAAAEDRGDRTWLSKILAPRLAFQRADAQKTVDDSDAYLQKVAPSGPRQTRVVEPIDICGDRAIVKCVVTTGGRDFHNIRLFVRRDGGWKLLGWANEAIRDSTG